MTKEESTVKNTNQNDTRGLVEQIGIKEIAFVAWVLTAGSYGFLASEYGNAAVDMNSTSPYPEHAWVFMAFGAFFGIALVTSVVVMIDCDD